MLESGEMYLETIYILSREIGSVRSVDVAERMGYSKPSVSRALGLLKKDGLVSVLSGGLIALTDEGLAIAEKIYERHTVLTELFMALGVEEETASYDACRIEHYLSDSTFEAIKNHIRKYS